jgi:hypothetical protein
MSRMPARLVELPSLELRTRAYHHRRAAAGEADGPARRMHLALAAEFQGLADRSRPGRLRNRQNRGGSRAVSMAEVISLSDTRAGRRKDATCGVG